MLVFAGTARTYNLYDTPGVSASAIAFAAGAQSSDAAANGFLTIWPNSATRPDASCLNYQGGLLTLSSVYSAVAKDGTFNIFSYSVTHVILDITGYFAPQASGGLWFVTYEDNQTINQSNSVLISLL